MRKKPEKNEKNEKNREKTKNDAYGLSHGGYGGLAEAAGEVRRGTLRDRQDQGLSAEARQHPGGVRRIEDACARPRAPSTALLAVGSPEIVAGVLQDCCLVK